MNLIASSTPAAPGAALAANTPRRTDLLLRNTHHAVAMLQVAEQGLSQAAVRLRAMVAFAAQAASSEATAEKRVQLDARFTWLREELRGIVADATFNGRSLLSEPQLQFCVTDDVLVQDLPAVLQGLDALQIATREGAVQAERELRLRQQELSSAAQACRLSLLAICRATDRSLDSMLLPARKMCA